MKRCLMFWRWMVIGLCGGLSLAALAREGIEPASSGEVTVVTSEKLTYDHNNKYALFERDVVVIDPEMKLTADTLTVRFDDAGKATSIQAEGAVRIYLEDQEARAGKVFYDIRTEILTLEDNPRVQEGRNMFEGDIITFFRKENKVICEPLHRMVIYNEEGDNRGKGLFFGE